MTWRARMPRTSATARSRSSLKSRGCQTVRGSSRSRGPPFQFTRSCTTVSSAWFAPSMTSRVSMPWSGSAPSPASRPSSRAAPNWVRSVPRRRGEDPHPRARPVVLHHLLEEGVAGRPDRVLQPAGGPLEGMVEPPAVDAQVVVDLGGRREARTGAPLPVVLDVVQPLARAHCGAGQLPEPLARPRLALEVRGRGPRCSPAGRRRGRRRPGGGTRPPRRPRAPARGRRWPPPRRRCGGWRRS